MLRSFITTLRTLLRLLFWPLHRATRKPCDVLRFTLKGAPPALPKRRDYFWDRRPPPMSVRTFQRRLKRAIDDSNLECILVDVMRFEAGWATLQTLHDLLAGAREAGKRVVAYLPEGGGLREYYVASAANEVWVSPSGALSLTGLGVEATYLAPALEKAGLKAQVEAVGRYKTAGEPFVHGKMTPENEEMLGEILDEIEKEIADSIEATRMLGPDRARQAMSGGPYSAAKAEELGLVDEVCYGDQLSNKLKKTDQKGNAKIRRWPAYARGRHFMGAWPLAKKKLPVVELKGMLVEGKNRGLKGVLNAKEAVKILQRLRRDKSVAAVVLYIDSRGGTVVASDKIRREIERLGRKKSVVAYMANVAASGGYMIAGAAHQIVAQPVSLTGSIGVVSGKVSGRRLLESLGLHRESVRRGAHAAFESPAEGWTASERRAQRELIEDAYRQFLEVVARGRRIPIEQVEASAEGRVWTGRAAHERGLVDHLGGLGRAIELARETTPEAEKALIQPIRPPRPKLPQLLLPQGLATMAAWATIAEAGSVWALEPLELRIH